VTTSKHMSHKLLLVLLLLAAFCLPFVTAGGGPSIPLWRGGAGILQSSRPVSGPATLPAAEAANINRLAGGSLLQTRPAPTRSAAP
jgi:hypothetical protein